MNKIKYVGNRLAPYAVSGRKHKFGYDCAKPQVKSTHRYIDYLKQEYDKGNLVRKAYHKAVHNYELSKNLGLKLYSSSIQLSNII